MYTEDMTSRLAWAWWVLGVGVGVVGGAGGACVVGGAEGAGVVGGAGGACVVGGAEGAGVVGGLGLFGGWLWPVKLFLVACLRLMGLGHAHAHIWLLWLWWVTR